MLLFVVFRTTEVTVIFRTVTIVVLVILIIAMSTVSLLILSIVDSVSTVHEHNATAIAVCTGSEQHSFVLKDLANVNRSLTPWLVVGGHRPFYIDSTNNMEPDGDQPVATALREAFEEAFFKYQVPVSPTFRTDKMQFACSGAVMSLAWNF